VLLPTGTGEEKPLPPSGLTDYYSAAWFPNGKQILFVAAGPGTQPRSYVQDLDGGEARPVTGEGELAVLVSPDGKLLATVGSEGCQLRPVEGGDSRPVDGILDGDELIQWSADGRYLYVRGPGNSSIEFFRVDLASGRRERWQAAEAADPVGFIGMQTGGVHMTPDGRSFVYNYWRTLTELYLVDGVK
jgi:Tol biopolymer transport system component